MKLVRTMFLAAAFLLPVSWTYAMAGDEPEGDKTEEKAPKKEKKGKKGKKGKKAEGEGDKSAGGEGGGDEGAKK